MIVAPEELGVEEVERAHVERRRHRHSGAVAGEPFGEVEPGLTVVEARVDVGAGDVEKPVGAHRLGRAHDDPHGECTGGAGVAGEDGPVAGFELQRHRLTVA